MVGAGDNDAVSARNANATTQTLDRQLVDLYDLLLDKAEVTGSSPVSPTSRKPSYGGVFSLRRRCEAQSSVALWKHFGSSWAWCSAREHPDSIRRSTLDRLGGALV